MNVKLSQIVYLPVSIPLVSWERIKGEKYG